MLTICGIEEVETGICRRAIRNYIRLAGECAGSAQTGQNGEEKEQIGSLQDKGSPSTG